MINRTVAPNIKEVENVDFIYPQTLSVNEHVSLFWIKDVPNSTARIDFYFDAGTIRSKSLVASLTAGMIFSGTKDKDAVTFHNLLDDLGAYYDVGVSQENAYVSFYGLTDQVLKIFKIFEEAMDHVLFPNSEFTEIIKERKQKLQVSLEKVSVLAQREFQSRLFDKSDYGRFANLEDFDSLTRSDIIDFFNQFYRNGLTKVVVVGDLKQKDIEYIAAQSKRWCVNQKPLFKDSFESEKSKSHLEKKDALQTALRIGKILFNKKHEDFISFTILNTILGDYFGSRLMKNIREDKGYTYGIGSFLSEINNTGYFIIATEVGKEFIGKTIDEVKKEIESLQTELIGDDELNLVRSYLLGQTLKSADGPYATMDLFIAVEQHNMNLEFYNKYIQKIRTIQAEELREIAKKYLSWDSLSLITAG